MKKISYLGDKIPFSDKCQKCKIKLSKGTIRYYGEDWLCQKCKIKLFEKQPKIIYLEKRRKTLSDIIFRRLFCGI
jgi:hypothetical protein